jgi:hypothetical protein
LDQKSDRGDLGAKERLHTGATLPTNRCHLDDTSIRIHRNDRDNTAVGKEDMVERTIGVHENLPTLTFNLLKFRQESREIARWQGK